MAKVTIVLEDKEHPDGETTLVVRPDFHGEEPNESSIAQAYAAELLNAILDSAKEVSYKGEPKGEPDPNKH